MTAAAFLSALQEEAGSAPNAATYAQWESGKRTPKDASLAPVFAFWDARGVIGPNMAPPAVPLSVEEQILEQTRRQADAMVEMVEATRQQNEMLRALLVRALSPDEELRDALLPLVRQFAEATPMPSAPQQSGPQIAQAR